MHLFRDNLTIRVLRDAQILPKNNKENKNYLKQIHKVLP